MQPRLKCRAVACQALELTLADWVEAVSPRPHGCAAWFFPAPSPQGTALLSLQPFTSGTFHRDSQPRAPLVSDSREGKVPQNRMDTGLQGLGCWSGAAPRLKHIGAVTWEAPGPVHNAHGNPGHTAASSLGVQHHRVSTLLKKHSLLPTNSTAQQSLAAGLRCMLVTNPGPHTSCVTIFMVRRMYLLYSEAVSTL